MSAAGDVEIRLLGRFAALRDGVEIPVTAFEGRKVRTLVKVLATRQGRFVSHDVLASALWPDRLPEDPAANLQVLVNRARRALGDPKLIRTGQRGYALAENPACRVDAERFMTTVSNEHASPAELREALTWWLGEPLPEESYDDWAAPYRSRVQRSYQHALERAAEQALADGEINTAVEFSSRAVAIEPLREVAVLLLVRSLAAAGDGSAAVTAYLDYRTALADELGVDPSPEAKALYTDLVRRQPGRTKPPRRQPVGDLGEIDFVGRTKELALISSTLSAPSRRGLVVTVSGVSGSGKSRFVDRAARDIPMVRVRAYLSESTEPWSLLRTLLREVAALDLGVVDGLPAPMKAALTWLLPELGGAPGIAPDPASRQLLVQEAALRLLDSTERAIAIDDLQWCDPSSLGIVEAGINRERITSVVLVYRPEEAAERADVNTFLARCSAALRINLGGLPEDALFELIPDRGIVEAITGHTDRTPMAVAQVLHALVTEGHVTSVAGRLKAVSPTSGERAAELAAAGQRAAIAARVAARAGHVADVEVDRTVLALLALLSRESSVPLLSAAAGAPPSAVHASLSRLFRRGLVRSGDLGWATSHDMVTDVVVAGLEPVDAARLHADLADALRADDDLALVAHHLHAAGDPRGASVAYSQAAKRALDSCADDEAAHLAEAGLDLNPAVPVRSALLQTRGEVRQRRGDIEGARDDLRSALAGSTGPARAAILARLALLASGADDIVRAASLAELAIAEAGPDQPARARALEVASILDMNTRREGRAAARAAEALTLYEQIGDAAGMARIIDARAMAQFLDGRVRDGAIALRRAADLFHDSGDLVRVLTPLSTAGHAQIFAGHPAEGLVQVDAALDLARTLGNLEGQSYALWHRAEGLVALGRPDGALSPARDALDIATRIRHRGWTATGWRAVGIVQQALGDLDGALHAFRSSLALSEHLGLFAAWASARAAMVLVELGTPAEARPFVERALREGPALGRYEARWAAAEVAAALGDSAAAQLSQDALRAMETGGVELGRDRLSTIAATVNPPASA